jgi:RNA polymerase sigma-70 factor (ECF subfamily)
MWMFGIARKQLLNHSRSSRRRNALAEQLRTEIATHSASISTEEAAAVRTAVSALPASQRELVRLVHWDGFSLEEAAGIKWSESVDRSEPISGRAKKARS